MSVSPSRWKAPEPERSMVSSDVRKEMMLVSWSMWREKRSNPSIAVSSGVMGSTTVTSISPSWMSAFGAMYALLPYCDALPHATINARSDSTPSLVVMR